MGLAHFIILSGILSGIFSLDNQQIQVTNVGYEIVHVSVPWYDAFQICSDKDMDLLYVETDEEFEFVRNLIVNSSAAGESFWSSGMDIVVNGTANGVGQFWTVTGATIEPNYWVPGEPNDNGGRYEACVMFMGIDDGLGPLLNDETCTTLCSVICKTRYTMMTPEPCPTPTPTTCPECPTTPAPTPCPPVTCYPCPTEPGCI